MDPLKKKYRQFLEDTPHRIFHSVAWLDAIWGEKWSALDLSKNDSVMAMWPFQIETYGKWKISRQPVLTPYLGPLFGSRPSDSHLTEGISTFYQKMYAARVIFLNQVPSPELNDKEWSSQFVSTTGYKDVLHDISNLEKVFSKMKHTRRNAVKRFNSIGAIEVGTDVSPLYELVDAAFRRRKSRVPFTRQILGRIHSLSGGQLLYAIQGNVILAGALIFHEGDRTYLLSCAKKYTAGNNFALPALIWRSIELASETNSQSFDFHGSMVPGIHAFNALFGAEPEPYLKVTAYCGLLGSAIKILRHIR